MFKQNIQKVSSVLKCGRKLIDECFLGLHNCEYPTECKNTFNGYTCECPDHMFNDPNNNCLINKISCDNGFKSVLGECRDINECDLLDICPLNAICTNLQGKFCYK